MRSFEISVIGGKFLCVGRVKLLRDFSYARRLYTEHSSYGLT